MHTKTPQNTVRPGHGPFELMDLVNRRLKSAPPWAVLLQLFIGFGWLRAVAEKVIDLEWWTGAVIAQFVAAHEDVSLTWYQPFLDLIVLPNTMAIALVVVLCQLLAGFTLITGRLLGIGLAVGMFLNLNFMAAGAVTPSAFYLLAQGAVALWLADSVRPAERTVRLEYTAVGAVSLAGLNLPFISTVHPAHVIDDPAMMFVFGGGLVALSCVLAEDTAPDAAPDAADGEAPTLTPHRAPGECHVD